MQRSIPLAQTLALVAAIAEHIAATDRIWSTDSPVTRLSRRAAALDAFEASRHAAYPLAWLVDTGRLAAEAEAALLGLSPRRFALAAVEIATALGSVRSCADAWRAAARAAAPQEPAPRARDEHVRSTREARAP